MEKQLTPRLRFSDFKDEWKIKKVENILSIGSGKDYKHLKGGEIPVYGTGGYMTSVNEFLYDGESVCIGRKGTIDKPIFLNGKFWTVDTLFYTHSFNQVLPRFVYSLFQNINWYKHNEASGVPSLSKKTIEKININLPSLPEQQKIAAFLTDVDEKITKLTKKKTLLEQYKKGIMQKIFNQELRFKDDNGNAFPKWEEKKLADIGVFKNGINKSKEDFGFGFPFVNLMDVFGKSTISDLDLGLVNANKSELENYSLKKGDILFIRSSVKREGVGATSLLLTDLPNTVYSGFLIRFRFKYEVVLGFKKYCFNTFLFRNKLLAKSTTSANTNINQDSLNTLTVLLPKSLEEQTKIANFLSDIDVKIETLNTKIENSKSFKKGLLQKMFV